MLVAQGGRYMIRVPYMPWLLWALLFLLHQFISIVFVRVYSNVLQKKHLLRRAIHEWTKWSSSNGVHSYNIFEYFCVYFFPTSYAPTKQYKTAEALYSILLLHLWSLTLIENLSRVFLYCCIFIMQTSVPATLIPWICHTQNSRKMSLQNEKKQRH